MNVPWEIILGEGYESYKKALNTLNLETLEERREYLCLTFARRCIKNEKTQKMFPLNIKLHNMETRNKEKFDVKHANTDRLRNSSIIYMQNLLNQQEVWEEKKSLRSPVRIYWYPNNNIWMNFCVCLVVLSLWIWMCIISSSINSL